MGEGNSFSLFTSGGGGVGPRSILGPGGGAWSQVQEGGGPRSILGQGGVPVSGPGSGGPGLRSGGWVGGYPVSVKGKIFDTRFGLIYVQTGKNFFVGGPPPPSKGKNF